MKRTGAIILSIMMVMVLTVTNLAGAYHTAARIYAAEEDAIGGEDNQDVESADPQDSNTSGGTENGAKTPAAEWPSTDKGGMSPDPAPVTIFTVTFDANGHGTAPGAVSVADGERVEKPADLSADGFLFTGWYRDVSATSAWNFDTDAVSGNITLYAGWTEIVGATSQEDASLSSSSGGVSVEYDASSEGGNNTSVDGTGAAQTTTENGDGGDASGTGGTTNTGDTPAATTYTVTFDANGHGTAPDAFTVMEGETVKKPAAPTEDGFTFAGWYKDKDATDAWDFDADTVTGNLTLYAGWTQNMQRSLRNTPALRNGNELTVTVNWGEGGSGTIFPSSGYTAKKIVRLFPSPSAGYVLKEWIVKSGDVTIEPTSGLNDYIFWMPDTDVVIDAVFERVYTVNVTNSGHGTASASVENGAASTQVALTATPDTGYRFKEWQVISGGITIDDSNTFTIGNADVEVHAVFERDPEYHFVTVTSSMYGTAEASAKGGTKTTQILLTAKPQSGYSFDRWEVVSGGVTVENDQFIIGDADVEIKAIFKYDPTNYFIKIDPCLANLKFGKPVTLQLSEGGHSGGAIVWRSEDPTTLSIDGDVATFHKTGTVTITVTQAANGAYAAVTDSMEVTIGKGDASTIDWPTPGPVYYKITFKDVALNGGSTEFGSFAWNDPYGTVYDNGGSTGGTRVCFYPKTELEEYFETNINTWVTYTVQARDTLESCIHMGTNVIDFGTVDEEDVSGLGIPAYSLWLHNWTHYSETPEGLNITANANDYFDIVRGQNGEANPLGTGEGIEFLIVPWSKLKPGSYEVPITFTCTTTSSKTATKICTAKIVIKAKLAEATDVTVSPDPIVFKVMEGYDSDAVAQIISITNNSAGAIEITKVAEEKFSMQYSFEQVSGSAVIPAGGTVQYRIKPRSGMTTNGSPYALLFDTDIRFDFKDADGNESRKKAIAQFYVYNYENSFSGLAITPDTVDFGTATEGYSLPEKKTLRLAVDSSPHDVIIKEDKYPRSDNYTIQLWQGSTQYQQGDFSINTANDPKITIVPKQGLTPGTYDETIEVEFYNFIGERVTKTIHLKFTVEAIGATVTATGDGHGTASASPSPAKEGTVVSLSATPDDGYQFSHWEVTSGGITLDEANSQMTTFKIGKEDVNVTAHFAQIPVGKRSVTVTTDGNGSAWSDPKSGAADDTVTITATAAEGYYFEKWEVLSGGVNLDDASNPSTAFTIKDKDVEIKAIFAKKASAPAITFPTASDITYGQMLADSVLTGGSTEYGTFTWDDDSIVPVAGNAGYGVTFKPSADTGRKYEPIPDANKTKSVDVAVSAATPVVTLSVDKQNTKVTAVVQRAGKGKVPTGTVKFEYSEDDGTTWADIAPAVALTEQNGNAEATAAWTSMNSNNVYQIRASYERGTNTNYNNTFATISFDPRKEYQTGFAVVASPAEVTYGDALSFNVSNAKGTGLLGYTVSDPSVMTVDEDGNATILKSGTVIVTATKEGDNQFNAATASVSVTVQKTKLTFTAEDKMVNQGGTMPALTCKTTGLVSGDTVSVAPDMTTTAADTNTEGTFDIQITGGAVITKSGATWTDCYEPQYIKGTLTVNAAYTVTVTKGTALVSGGTAAATIQAFPGDTVTVTADTPQAGYKFDGWNVKSGTITLSDANKATATFVMPKENVTIEATYAIDQSSDDVEIRTQVTGLTAIPASLQKLFASVEALEDAMLLKLGVSRSSVGGGWASYDIKLMVSFDGGSTWVETTKDNFPKGGLTVYLPYPSGTNQNTHRFKVSHMFTEDFNGHKPGEIETPQATNTAKGIRVVFQSLSPVVVTWEKVTNSGGSSSSGSGSSSVSGTYTPVPVAQIKQNFDSKYYADTYADLKAAFGYDHDALWNHYVTFGKNERRKVRFIEGINRFQEGIFNYADRWQMDDVMMRRNIPSSAYFDTDAYADLYPDLKAAFGYDHELLYRHYLEFGKKEGRKVYTRVMFNAKAYADRYPDLKKAFGYDRVALWRHYQMFGKVERRYVEWLEDEGQKD